MNVTFQVNESGVRSKNVDLPDAESWIAGDGVYAAEAKALLAFTGCEGIPEQFEDDDQDGLWVLVEEGEGQDNDTSLHTYEFRERRFSALRNSGGESREFETEKEAVEWVADFREGVSFFPEDSIEHDDDGAVYVTVEGDEDPNCVGSVHEVFVS